MVELAASGHDVVLDHGLWRRADRGAVKAMIRAAGARWRLVHFDVDRTELARRLVERNRRADALPVTESALDDFIARFEPPAR